LWTTEFGWATFEGLRTVDNTQPPNPPDQPFFGFINQVQQANYTLRAFQLGQERPYLGPMILWNLRALRFDRRGRDDPITDRCRILDGAWRPRLPSGRLLGSKADQIQKRAVSLTRSLSRARHIAFNRHRTLLWPKSSSSSLTISATCPRRLHQLEFRLFVVSDNIKVGFVRFIFSSSRSPRSHIV
jgi:hypothetical protein